MSLHLMYTTCTTIVSIIIITKISTRKHYIVIVDYSATNNYKRYVSISVIFEILKGSTPESGFSGALKGLFDI